MLFTDRQLRLHYSAEVLVSCCIMLDIYDDRHAVVPACQLLETFDRNSRLLKGDALQRCSSVGHRRTFRTCCGGLLFGSDEILKQWCLIDNRGSLAAIRLIGHLICIRKACLHIRECTAWDIAFSRHSDPRRLGPLDVAVKSMAYIALGALSLKRFFCLSVLWSDTDIFDTMVLSN